jgi:hypothetical protein
MTRQISATAGPMKKPGTRVATDLEAMGLPIDQGVLFEMDMQKFTQQLTDANNATSRRSVFGLLAGALAVAGFAGLQSADARRRGNGGNGGRGNGHGGRRGGRGNNRNNRH